MREIEEFSKEFSDLMKSSSGHWIVLAGPGCGKTHTIIEKIFYIFQYNLIPEPYGLLALTFTDHAARIMKRRLRDKGFHRWHRIWVGTFHSFGNYLLRCYGSDVGIPEDFEIIDKDDRVKILENLNTKYKVAPNVKSLDLIFNKLIRKGIYPEDVPECYTSAARDSYKEYYEILRENYRVDFGDLISLPIKLLNKSHFVKRAFTNFFRYLAIDEFQDTDAQQLELVKILTKKIQGSIIVGDEDQSIFRWRGARKENLLNIKDFLNANQIKLSLNFRSDEVIILAAQKVIGFNRDHIEKNMNPVSSEKGELYFQEFKHWEEEASIIVKWIAKYEKEEFFDNLAEIAVIARVRWRLDKIALALQNKEIPWFDRNQYNFQDSWEIYLAFGILNLFHNPFSSEYLYEVLTALEDSGLERIYSDTQPLEIALNIQKKLISLKKDLKVLKDLTDIQSILQTSDIIGIIRKTSLSRGDQQYRLKNLHKMIEPLYEESKKLGVPQAVRKLCGKDAIQIISGHQSKGGEFKIVFFIGLEDDVLPHYKSHGKEDELAEERRIFYVGLTRAKKIAYLTCVKKIWRKQKIQSRFISHIPKEYFSIIQEKTRVS